MSKSLSLPYFLTGGTSTRKLALVSLDARIGAVIWVTVWAMTLFGIVNSRSATSDILQMRHGFQVVRIYTKMYAAFVVNFFSSWNFSNKQFIRDHVRESISVSIVSAGPCSELSIRSSAPERSHPEPATAFGYWKNEGHKAFNGWSWLRAAGHYLSIQEACA